MTWCHVQTPLGRMTLVASDEGLRELRLKGEPGEGPATKKHPVLDQARAELAEYFAKERRDFEVPLDAEGTEFQRKVWRALVKIPFGRTDSYGGLAKRLGQPTASRAVGLANGQNPIAIIVPCHRVIGADGSLTGYAGGLERKRWLLAHESEQAELFAGR